jgi:hypothetical protein
MPARLAPGGSPGPVSPVTGTFVSQPKENRRLAAPTSLRPGGRGPDPEAPSRLPPRRTLKQAAGRLCHWQ